MKAWRVEKNKRLATAWTGEGARIAGGRWNSPGLPAVYLSEHLSLALLEILVHSPDSNQRKVARSQATVEIPEKFIEALPPAALPPEFGPNASTTLTRELGDRWLQEQRSAVLRVPSVIVPVEHNFILNPAHRDFAKITLGPFTPITLDARLWAVPAS